MAPNPWLSFSIRLTSTQRRVAESILLLSYHEGVWQPVVVQINDLAAHLSLPRTTVYQAARFLTDAGILCALTPQARRGQPFSSTHRALVPGSRTSLLTPPTFAERDRLSDRISHYHISFDAFGESGEFIRTQLSTRRPVLNATDDEAEVVYHHRERQYGTRAAEALN